MGLFSWLSIIYQMKLKNNKTRTKSTNFEQIKYKPRTKVADGSGSIVNPSERADSRKVTIALSTSIVVVRDPDGNVTVY